MPLRKSKSAPRKKFEILGEAALKINPRAGYRRHFRPTPPAADAARDGSEARAKGPYPSGTGITRREQREMAVTGKHARSAQVPYLPPVGRNNAAGLGPTMGINAAQRSELFLNLPIWVVGYE